MSFELRDHTADVAVEARGESLDAVFGAVADGLAAAACESVPAGGERRSVAVRAESREALLFDYLDELVYRRDVEAVLPVDNEARVEPPGEGETDGDDATDGWALSGSYRAVPLSEVTAREIKAVTYSEMRVEQTGDGWSAYVVFDV